MEIVITVAVIEVDPLSIYLPDDLSGRGEGGDTGEVEGRFSKRENEIRDDRRTCK